MDESFQSLFANLPPEVLEQLMALSAMDERGAGLQRQMIQANQLANGPEKSYHGPIGAGLGGLAGAVNGLTGTLHEQDLRRDHDALLAEQVEGRKAFAGLLGQQGQPEPAPAAPPPGPTAQGQHAGGGLPSMGLGFGLDAMGLGGLKKPGGGLEMLLQALRGGGQKPEPMSTQGISQIPFGFGRGPMP